MRTSSNKIWIDGCFDFAHHGHAGAMRQARQFGDELYVGVHSDEDILINKGPSVMTLRERMEAVEGCRWCSKAIEGAPYVTDYKVMDSFGCEYVVHGDDITTDKDGNDCYQEVKDMGRFLVVKRTANISTTDLVGRMLLFTKDHHIGKIEELLSNEDNVMKYKEYATGEDAKSPGANVWVWNNNSLNLLVEGKSKPLKFVYIDGGFDLFNPGHILALKNLKEIALNNDCQVIVGVVDDQHVNIQKGKNYPIMNLFERSLCVLQSKYIDGVVLGAPQVPTLEYLKGIGQVVGVYHGAPRIDDELYKEVELQGLFKHLPKHEYEDMAVETIVERVLANREKYEERQRRKGVPMS